MKLYLVQMHNQQPGVILYDYTRAKASKRAKRMFGADKVDEVIPISRQDAEIEFGDNYMQQARWNMLRSEDMNEVSVLTGDNPFLEEKMNMKKADMGDVVDDFYKSDAPQFQGKSKAKRRQMAIAAKLQANEEEKQHYKLSTVSEGIDQKVLTQFKTMLKDGEEDSVRLLLQGMPKHTKKMYMSRLGIKESDRVDGRTKAFRETIKRLNMAKSVPVQEETYKGVEIGKWKYEGPREFAEKLIDKFGKPDHVEMNPETGEAGSVLFNDIDGFDFVRVVDSNTNKLHPYPAKIYVEGGLHFKVPREMVGKLKEASPTIMIDELNGYVIGKCASLGIAAATVQFVIDAVNGDAPPTRAEYDKRLKSIIDNNEYDPKITWWENSLNEEVADLEEDKKMLKIAKSLVKSSKGHAKQAKYIRKHVKDLDNVDEDISKMPNSHVKFFATKKIPHGRYTRAEINDEHRRRQKVEPNYHKVKPSINETELDERTPIKPVIVDRKQPNLKIPNPNYKPKNLMKKRTVRSETKEAPPGTYFTRSGQLKKGDPASDGKGGAKLASDPLDKQRKTIVNLKNYPK